MLIKASSFNFSLQENKEYSSNAVNLNNSEKKLLEGVNSKEVDFSLKAVNLSNINHSFGELNHRQERTLELNEAIHEKIGLKDSLNNEERELEKKYLKRKSQILGFPIKQLSEIEKDNVEELYTKVDLIYAKGLVTLEDEKKVNDIFNEINTIDGGNHQHEAYSTLTPSQKVEMDKIDLELMKLDGVEVIEGDIEATFKAMAEKIQPFTHEQDLIFASSVSDYQSFSLTLSISLSGINATGDGIANALFDLFSFSTPSFSHFNYIKAKSLFSLATEHIDKQGKGSEKLVFELDKFKDADLLAEKDSRYNIQSTSNYKNAALYSTSKYEINISSFSQKIR
jgi:hypothetical protein